jgi:exonuclease VII small subunit
MSQAMIDQAKAELEAAQSTLDAALRAWDESVSELWRTSLALTQAQKRVTRAHELLRSALSATDNVDTERHLTTATDPGVNAEIEDAAVGQSADGSSQRCLP